MIRNQIGYHQLHRERLQWTISRIPLRPHTVLLTGTVLDTVSDNALGVTSIAAGLLSAVTDSETEALLSAVALDVTDSAAEGGRELEHVGNAYCLLLRRI